MIKNLRSLVAVSAFFAVCQTACGSAVDMNQDGSVGAGVDGSVDAGVDGSVGAGVDGSVATSIDGGDLAPTPMVLVHGAFHGAWAWEKMLALGMPNSLDVRAITLPGTGEDSANASPAVTLDTHIAYVNHYLETNNLRNVTLVVHSYAGIVGAGVLRDDAAGRVSKYVCIDCVVPAGGMPPQSFLQETEVNPTQLPPAQTQLPLCSELWDVKPFIAQLFGLLNSANVNYVNSHLTCQPGTTFVQPLTGFDAAAYRRVQATYVYTDFTHSKGMQPYTPSELQMTAGDVGPWFGHDVFLKFANRSVQFGFKQVTLDGAAHDCMISDPMGTRAALIAIATGQ
jgi:pimeloyl-ACP methyl ester carboxylesterase